MRLLLLLLIVGAGAFFTSPAQDAHEQAFLEARASEQTNAIESQAPALSLDGVLDFVTGMLAGQGRYETFYVASKYTLDMPGSAYLECWGAFTFVQCQEVYRAAQG